MKVASLSTPRTGRLYPKENPCYSFLAADSTPGLEGLGQWIIQKTPSKVELATCRLLAQHLNQLRYRTQTVHTQQ